MGFRARPTPDFRFLRGRLQALKIEARQRKWLSGRDDLLRLARRDHERGPQHLMASNDLGNTLFQGRHLQLAAETDSGSQIVARIFWLQLSEEPQSLLGE